MGTIESLCVGFLSFSKQSWQQNDTIRRRQNVEFCRGNNEKTMSNIEILKDFTTYDTSYDCDASSPIGCRHHGNRNMARP